MAVIELVICLIYQSVWNGGSYSACILTFCRQLKAYIMTLLNTEGSISFGNCLKLIDRSRI